MSSSNLATHLQANLKENNFTTWGFVIYRCTYSCSSDWARLLQNIHAHARSHLEIYDGLDLLSSFELTIRDDKAAFDGASIETCRDHFNAWVSSPSGRNSEQLDALPTATGFDGQPRYSFFLHVDSDALDSVVRRAPQPPADDMEGAGYVNIVDARWTPIVTGEKEVDLDGNVVDYDDQEEEEVQDWQRVGIWGLIPGVYMALMGDHLWWTEFGKPPHVWVES